MFTKPSSGLHCDDMHSARTSSTSYFSPGITAQDQLCSDASPRVLSTLPRSEIETGKDQGAMQPSIDGTRYSRAHVAADPEAKGEVCHHGLSLSDGPGCQQVLPLSGHSDERQTCHSLTYTEGKPSTVPSTAHKLSGHSVQCGSVAETTARADVVYCDTPFTGAAQESMEAVSRTHQELQIGPSPAPMAGRQESISTAENDAAAVTLAGDTPEYVGKSKQESYQASVSLSEDDPANSTGAATDKGPLVPSTGTPKTPEVPAGSPSTGVPTARSALQRPTEAAAMIGPFGCSMGFVQLAVPWAPQHSALHGVSLAPAALVAPQNVRQQPQATGCSDGQRHQQLLHQLLLQETSQQHAIQDELPRQPHNQVLEPQASVPQSAQLPSPAIQIQPQKEKRKGKNTPSARKIRDAGGIDDERHMQDAAAACQSSSAPSSALEQTPCTARCKSGSIEPVSHSCAQSRADKPHDMSMANAPQVPNTSSASSLPGTSKYCGGKGAITMFKWPESMPGDADDILRSIDTKSSERPDSMDGPPEAPPARRTCMRASIFNSPKLTSARRPQGKRACAAQEPTGDSATAYSQPEQQNALTWKGKCTAMDHMLQNSPSHIERGLDDIVIPEGIKSVLEKAAEKGLPEFQAFCFSALGEGPHPNDTGRKVVKVKRRAEKGGSSEVVAQKLADLAAAVAEPGAIVEQEDPARSAAIQSANTDT